MRMYNTIGLKFVYISNTVVKIWTEKALCIIEYSTETIQIIVWTLIICANLNWPLLFYNVFLFVSCALCISLIYAYKLSSKVFILVFYLALVEIKVEIEIHIFFKWICNTRFQQYFFFAHFVKISRLLFLFLEINEICTTQFRHLWQISLL